MSPQRVSTLAWIAIGLVVLAVGIGVYQLGRHRHHAPPPGAAAA
jgi:uncharacterized membrane protein